MKEDYREVTVDESEEVGENYVMEVDDLSEMKKLFETQIQYSCNETVCVDQRNPNPDPTELYNLYLLADTAEVASEEREREKELESSKKNLVEEEEEERKNSLINLLIPKRKRSRRLNLNNDFKEFDSSMYERCWRVEKMIKKPPIVIEEEESKINVKKEIKTAAARVVSLKRRHIDDDDDDIDIAKKNKKIKNWVVFKLEPPNLPVNFREKIQRLQGTDLVLVIQKVLHGTDVSRGHSRMSIPLTQIKDNKFLTEDEMTRLNIRNGKNVTEIEALLIEPNERVSFVGIRKWKMEKPDKSVSYVYNLVKNWNKIVENNKLYEDTIVQLWAFRGAQSQLCFVLVKIGRIDDNARVCLDGHEDVGSSTIVGGTSRAVNGDGNTTIGESSGATGMALVEKRVMLKLKIKKPSSTTDLE